MVLDSQNNWFYVPYTSSGILPRAHDVSETDLFSSYRQRSEYLLILVLYKVLDQVIG
jgi:hypothetical protein